MEAVIFLGNQRQQLLPHPVEVKSYSYDTVVQSGDTFFSFFFLSLPSLQNIMFKWQSLGNSMLGNVRFRAASVIFTFYNCTTSKKIKCQLLFAFILFGPWPMS